MLQQTKNEKITSSEGVFKVFDSILKIRSEEDQHKEFFYTLGLDSQNRILFVDLVAIGTVNECGPSIRECFRQAIIKNACAVIVCHNHPSGKTEPSQEDNNFTKKTVEAGRILGVKLLDHIIAGEGYYSFSDEGRI